MKHKRMTYKEGSNIVLLSKSMGKLRTLRIEDKALRDLIGELIMRVCILEHAVCGEAIEFDDNEVRTVMQAYCQTQAEVQSKQFDWLRKRFERCE